MDCAIVLDRQKVRFSALEVDQHHWPFQLFERACLRIKEFMMGAVC
jgi:hypothetical protein